MVDWFVVLTPILVLPLALLIFFVGCVGRIGSGCTAADVEVFFNIEFYLVSNRHGHTFRFEIFHNTLELASTEAIINEPNADGSPSLVVRGFGDCLPPGDLALRCEVTDLADGEVLVANGDQCDRLFQQSEHWRVHFIAGTSDSGPDEEFAICIPELLSS